MKKRICLVLLGSLLMSILICKSFVLKNENPNQIEFINLTISAGDSVGLGNTQNIYKTEESIPIVFEYSLITPMESYSYECNGFNIVDEKKEESRIVFSVVCEEKVDPYLTVYLNLEDQSRLTSTAHGYSENGLFAMNAVSFIDAKADLKYYEYKNGIISKKDYERFKKEYNQSVGSSSTSSTGGSNTYYLISLIFSITFGIAILILIAYIIYRTLKKKKKYGSLNIHKKSFKYFYLRDFFVFSHILVILIIHIIEG